MVSSIQFSKNLVPCRAYYRKRVGRACQEPGATPSRLFRRAPTAVGPQRYGRHARLSTPYRQTFLGVSRRAAIVALGRLDKSLTGRRLTLERATPPRRFWRNKKGPGGSPKARKVCLGWISRQDGGRLVESSGTPPPSSHFQVHRVMPGGITTREPEACPPCRSSFGLETLRHNPSIEGISRANKNDS